MNVNKIITIASIAAVLASGTALIWQKVNEDGGESTGAMSAQQIAAEVQDKSLADEYIAELRKKADIQEKYNAYFNYYSNTSDKNNTVKSLRSSLNSNLQSLKEYADECAGKIDLIDNAGLSQSQRKLEAQNLANDECFVKLEECLGKCETLKKSLEAEIAAYNNELARQKAEQEKANKTAKPKEAPRSKDKYSDYDNSYEEDSYREERRYIEPDRFYIPEEYYYGMEEPNANKSEHEYKSNSNKKDG